MKANVWKSESGQLVVVSCGETILLELHSEGNIFMFTNPDKPGVFLNQIRQVEYENGQTPEQIIAKARKSYETNTPLDTSENHG